MTHRVEKKESEIYLAHPTKDLDLMARLVAVQTYRATGESKALRIELDVRARVRRSTIASSAQIFHWKKKVKGATTQAEAINYEPLRGCRGAC